MNVKAPKDRYIILRQLLTMIRAIWQHRPEWYAVGIEALWIATLAGAANSKVPYGAVREANEVLGILWRGTIPIEEAMSKLQTILKGE